MTDKSFIVNGRLSLADIPMSDGGQKLTASPGRATCSTKNTSIVVRRQHLAGRLRELQRAAHLRYRCDGSVLTHDE
jgi:hypothetical protein